MIYTKRYASNLLKKGRNDEFTIIKLERKYAVVQELQVGYYYDVTIVASNNKTSTWVGVAPFDAVLNCLYHGHGVEFR